MSTTEIAATDRWRQALEEIAAAGREATETGLPIDRFLSVSEAVGIAADALRNGHKQNKMEGR